jgi:hypothetical protein
MQRQGINRGLFVSCSSKLAMLQLVPICCCCYSQWVFCCIGVYQLRCHASSRTYSEILGTSILWSIRPMLLSQPCLRHFQSSLFRFTAKKNIQEIKRRGLYHIVNSGGSDDQDRMQLRRWQSATPPRMAGSTVRSPLPAQFLLSTPTSPSHFQLNLATSAAEIPCPELLGASRKRSRPQ